MSVYVDQPRHPYGRMIMCHMTADSLDELHQMADQIGVARRHFQCHPNARNPHYDICKASRAKALKLGAKEVGTREIIQIGRKLRNAGDNR
jgi:hypothetical protein